MVPPKMVATEDSSFWADAEWSAALLALIGHPLGGVHLRAPPGPVRDHWLERLTELSGQPRLRKIPANIPEGRLLGGIDLGATLQHGKPIAETGLLGECDGQIVVAAMTERLPRNTVHHLCSALDNGQIIVARDAVEANLAARLTLVAQDEGMGDEWLHGALADRLGITLDMTELGIHDVEDEYFTPRLVERARGLLDEVQLTDAQLATVTSLALSLGIDSPRAALAAIKVARGCAALAGETMVAEHDIARALRLCLLPRAQQIPDAAEPPPPEPEPEESENEDVEPPPAPEQPPPDEERLLEAAMAHLPEGLLAQLQTRGAKTRQSSTGSAGEQHRHQNRGRPTGVMRGDHRRGGRINILATLRAAAPWQPLRKREAAERATPRSLEIRRDDIHLTRFQQRRDTLTLFVVDASGSAALQRLAEAKGAVELLLADCYVRRDQVALIAFRDETAELLLPPTRSLVRAKKALAALPGGGATPMAAALELTRDLAERAAKQGTTAQYVMLTDGAANVARDGTRNREAGTRDALDAARRLALSPSSGLIIDTAQRPQPRARELADTLGGKYIALPQADAHTLNKAIRASSL